jgi:hypothetical protein
LLHNFCHFLQLPRPDDKELCAEVGDGVKG